MPDTLDCHQVFFPVGGFSSPCFQGVVILHQAVVCYNHPVKKVQEVHRFPVPRHYEQLLLDHLERIGWRSPLPLTPLKFNISPLKSYLTSQVWKGSSSNHPFSGAVLVLVTVVLVYHGPVQTQIATELGSGERSPSILSRRYRL